MGAGKGWSSQENLLACQAFVAASENSRTGNGQKTEKFELSIENAFPQKLDEVLEKDVTFKASAPRSGSSISQLLKLIRKACINFHGVIESIHNANPTGSPSETDIDNAATAVYNELATAKDMYNYFGTSNLKVGKPFLFLNCYKWLQTTYLWKMIVSANQASRCDEKLSDKETPDNITLTESSSEDEPKVQKRNSHVSNRRPIGAKRAAAQSQQVAVLARGASEIEGLAGESKRRNEIAAQLLEVEKRNSRMSLFQMEGTARDVRDKFLLMEQKRVLLEMESEQRAIEISQKKRKVGDKSQEETGFEESMVSIAPKSELTPPSSPVNISNDESVAAGAIVSLAATN